MRKLFYIIMAITLVSCDYQGSYTFIAKNETSKNIELHFLYKNRNYADSSENGRIIKLTEGQEKTIRIINAPLNSKAHDCLREHGMSYFQQLVFDTFIDSVKIEKQLWQPENWDYEKKSKWAANYTLKINNELISTNNNFNTKTTANLIIIDNLRH